MEMVAAKRIAARKTYGGADNSIPGYLEQEVLLWSPEKITLKTFDLFLISAKRKDERRMKKILAELMGALNFEMGELPQRMHRIYEYCQRCISNGKYEEASGIILELRNTWEQTFGLSTS